MMSFASESADGVCPAQKKCFGFVSVDVSDVPGGAPTPAIASATASISATRAAGANKRADCIRSIPPDTRFSEGKSSGQVLPQSPQNEPEGRLVPNPALAGQLTFAGLRGSGARGAK